MKNTFGSSLCVTLFGESHGEGIGAVLDGLCPGLKIDIDYVNRKLSQRKPYGKISTSRTEADAVEFLSGVYNGYTTGSPLTVFIKNENTKSGDYASLNVTPRPSHADYTARCKYRGFNDYRGGGHFSGRVTAALVAVGAILQYALEQKGIFVATHISKLKGVADDAFSDYEADIKKLSNALFPVLSEKAEEDMKKVITQAAESGDSVGGILESCVIGLPVGVGEPWFDSFEGVLSHALFSVPGVKGVEFGAGFALADMYGSEANDEFYTDGRSVYSLTNNNGGVNGGITNGMPVIFRCAVKPTPSIFKEQGTVDLDKMCNARLNLKGRHDPAIIHRARAVVDAVTAITVADLLCVKYGTDFLFSGDKK